MHLFLSTSTLKWIILIWLMFTVDAADTVDVDLLQHSLMNVSQLCFRCAALCRSGPKHLFFRWGVVCSFKSSLLRPVGQKFENEAQERKTSSGSEFSVASIILVTTSNCIAIHRMLMKRAFGTLIQVFESADGCWEEERHPSQPRCLRHLAWRSFGTCRQ